jgi:hypothetical protein
LARLARAWELHVLVCDAACRRAPQEELAQTREVAGKWEAQAQDSLSYIDRCVWGGWVGGWGGGVAGGRRQLCALGP